MRGTLKLTMAAVLGLVSAPAFANDESTHERDYLPTRAGVPATFWSGAAPATASSDAIGGGGGEQDMAPAEETATPRSDHDFLPTRSGVPATLWSGVAPAGSSAITGEDQVGGGSGEPDRTSAVEDTASGRGDRDFLPTRSGTPAKFWTGSR